MTYPRYPRVGEATATQTTVAWDIETCPLPEDHLTDVHHERSEKEILMLRQRQPELAEDEVRRMVKSTHPFVGRICCISAVAGTLEAGHRSPRSFVAAELDDEPVMLEMFWDAVAQFSGRLTWVTFNGKRFDVPYLLARSAHYGIAPTRRDLVNTYPYKHRPHADLYGVWPCCFTLHDLCQLLDVETSKNGFGGKQVAQAINEGRIDDVVRYCERDVVATWNCYKKLRAFLN